MCKQLRLKKTTPAIAETHDRTEYNKYNVTRYGDNIWMSERSEYKTKGQRKKCPFVSVSKCG